MNRLANRMAGLVVVGAVAGGAFAANEFTINVYTGSFDQNGEIVNGSETLYGSWQWDANTNIVFDGSTLPAIDDSPTFTRINIYGSSSDDLGLVQIPGTGTNNVHVLVGFQTTTRADTTDPTESLVRDVAGFIAGSNVRLKMSITGNIMANIICNDIRRIDVGGSHRFGQVKANTRGPEFMIVAGDVESAATFSPHILAAGSVGIADLRIGGELAGRVETTDADLSTLVIDGELTGEINIGGDITGAIICHTNIGTSTTNAAITCKGDIAEVSAGGDVWVDIEAYDGVIVDANDEAVTLPRLDILTVGGDLHGSFTGPGIGALSVGGDLYADLTVGVLRRGFFGDDDWRIGGSFKDGAVIETRGRVVSASQGTTWGLRGTVVFNNNFDAMSPGVWEQGALIRIKRLDTGGFIELTGDGYTNFPYTQGDMAEGIGGGAAGVASFDLHGEGCIPADGAVVALQSGIKLPSPPAMSDAGGAVLVRHYGPVTWDSLSGDLPVTIKRRRNGSMGGVGRHHGRFCRHAGMGEAADRPCRIFDARLRRRGRLSEGI